MCLRSLRPIPGFLYLSFEELLFLSRPLCRDELHSQFGYLAGEPERWLVIVVVHARSRVHTDIERLVDRDHERDGVGDRLGGDGLPVNRQDTGAAFSETAPVVFEIMRIGYATSIVVLYRQLGPINRPRNSVVECASVQCRSIANSA